MRPLCLAICSQALIASCVHCPLPLPSNSPTLLELFEHTKPWLYSYILTTDYTSSRNHIGNHYVLAQQSYNSLLCYCWGHAVTEWPPPQRRHTWVCLHLEYLHWFLFHNLHTSPDAGSCLHPTAPDICVSTHTVPDLHRH